MLKIKRIISIVDTREYEEVADGIFKPIAGSGDLNQCSRCNRMHEVHATVELENGEHAIVGTGCMSQESLDVQKAAKNGTSSAKCVARKQAELRKLRAHLAAFRDAEAKVDAMPLPPIEGPIEEPSHDLYRLDDAFVHCPDFSGRRFDDERRAQLISSWKRRRIAEIVEAAGFSNTYASIVKSEVDAIERKLKERGIE
jgi:hypothetical protein